MKLATRPNSEFRIGTDEVWDKAEGALKHALDANGIEYEIAEGDAAFYGPKIDVQVESAIGHDITLSTVQLDYQLPERFELEYVDENNQKVRPVVVHRAILGSLDRFAAFLIEETAGNFPLWLCPLHAKILPISDKFIDYCKDVQQKMRENGLAVDIDERNEKISYKIRSAISEKVPYLVIIGENEINENAISVRKRGTNETVKSNVDEFIEMLKKEIKDKK